MKEADFGLDRRLQRMSMQGRRDAVEQFTPQCDPIGLICTVVPATKTGHTIDVFAGLLCIRRNITANIMSLSSVLTRS